jgi:hypothetical protein
MRKITTFLILCAICTGFHSNLLWAGAWGEQKGHSFHSLSYSYYRTSHEFESYGDIERFENSGRFQKHQINYYTEIGLTERFTGVGNFFYDWIEFKNNFGRDRNDGLSDQELGLQYRITKSPKYVLSFLGLVAFPAYSIKESPRLGNQSVSLEPRLLFGKNLKFFDIPAYTNIEVGYRFRTEEPSDQIRYQFLLGLKPKKDWEIIGAIDGIEGMRNEEPIRTADNVTIRPDFSLIKLRAELIVPLREQIALEIGCFYHVLGRDTGQGWGVKSGIRVNV